MHPNTNQTGDSRKKNIECNLYIKGTQEGNYSMDEDQFNRFNNRDFLFEKITI